jgi:hypothetical protein
MTRPVRLVIERGGDFLGSYQEIHGEIVGIGRADNGDDCIVFRDEDSERKIPLKKIKTLTTDVNRKDTT